jgi:hypothetical protein
MTKLPILSKQGKPFAKVHYWLSTLALVLVLGGLFAFNTTQHTTQAHAASPVTVWLQVMDSCKQALPFAKFTLVAPSGTTIATGTSAGTGRVTVSSGTCVLQRGNCTIINHTGCVSFTIASPTTGTYKIKEHSTSVSVSGITFLENPKWPTASSGFVPCNGGSACRGESATFTITSGVVKGTTKNTYPDGTTTTYPTVSGVIGTFSGTLTDPIVFHNFQLGTGNCDGDHDKDDFLTGSASTHCDSEHD